jgi:hypothetical protein
MSGFWLLAGLHASIRMRVRTCQRHVAQEQVLKENKIANAVGDSARDAQVVKE